MDCVCHDIIGSKRHRAGRLSCPEQLEIAPNQIVMITTRVIAALNPATNVVSQPEVELGGIRVSVKQADYGSVNVNLFGIRQHECPAARPTCDPLTSLTLVMPLEITVDRDAVLVINDRGKDLAPIPLRIVPDKIHILNSRDTAAIFIGVAQEAQGRCGPILQSRNGRLISRENPARPVAPHR